MSTSFSAWLRQALNVIDMKHDGIAHKSAAQHCSKASKRHLRKTRSCSFSWIAGGRSKAVGTLTLPPSVAVSVALCLAERPHPSGFLGSLTGHSHEVHFRKHSLFSHRRTTATFCAHHTREFVSCLYLITFIVINMLCCNREFESMTVLAMCTHHVRVTRTSLCIHTHVSECNSGQE